MKYIDAEKLKKRLQNSIQMLQEGEPSNEITRIVVEHNIKVYKIILEFINSLQQEQTQNADANNIEHASNLKHWLAFFGIPDENIENCITQIAQGYGAIRYLEGVQHGAEAVNELSQQEHPEVELEKEINLFWDRCIKHKNERGGNVIWSNKIEVEALARHFYELGLKAKEK